MVNMKKEYDLGEVFCDMHNVRACDGVVVGFWKIRKLIQIDTNKAREMLDLLLGDAKWQTCNKHAVVIGETWDGKGYQCAYSYDGDRFGLFEVEPL